LLRELESAVARGQPLDHTLARHYRQHRELGSRDRRFFSALAFAWFRWRGWLANPAEPNTADLVLAWLLDAADSHPASDLLAAQLSARPAPLKPLGPAPLSEKTLFLGQWRQGPPPAMEDLVPAWLPAALYYPAGLDQAEHRRRCIQAFQTRPPTWLRISSARAPEILARLGQALGTSKEDLSFPLVGRDLDRRRPSFPQDGLSKLRPYNNRVASDQTSAAACHPRLSQAVCLPQGYNQEILKTMPEVEIQDLASQVVGLICAPRPGDNWWDACAGAGGKSLHLADLMQNAGSILATDPRADSLAECRRRLARNRIKIITPRTWDGTAATAPEHLFDGVLVDAPCSGIGTWGRNPDARWRTPPDSISNHAKLQAQLLRIGADRVRPGGRLVYSVCTLTRAETGAVIENFLAERKDFSLAPAPHPLTGATDPGPFWIWPWEGPCNGMFIADLNKT
jgi:16S rRNA (cytosine967-C5)-methyltransferase